MAKCYHCRGQKEVHVPSPIIIPVLKESGWRFEPLCYVRLPCICTTPGWSHLAPFVS